MDRRRVHHPANHGVPAGPSQHQAVRNALDGLTVYQLYDVLKQMKELCQKKPKDAERILLSKPSLAQALLQAQQMLGMVHTSPAGLELPRDPSVQQPGAGGAVGLTSSVPSSSLPTAVDSSSRNTSRASSMPTTGGISVRDRRPLPPQSGLRNASQQLPPGQPPLLMPAPAHNQGGPPPSVRGGGGGRGGPGVGPAGGGRRSASAPRGAPPQQQRMPPAPAPPGTRIIAGFDNPVPENLVQQALSLGPAQIQQLQPQQQRTIQMIRQAVQQQSYGGYAGGPGGGGGAYGGPPPPQPPGGYGAPPQRGRY